MNVCCFLTVVLVVDRGACSGPQDAVHNIPLREGKTLETGCISWLDSMLCLLSALRQWQQAVILVMPLKGAEFIATNSCVEVLSTNIKYTSLFSISDLRSRTSFNFTVMVTAGQVLLEKLAKCKMLMSIFHKSCRAANCCTTDVT